jgi:hypothetical protein
MHGLNGMQEKRTGAGAVKGGHDLSGDDAGLADTTDDNPPL